MGNVKPAANRVVMNVLEALRRCEYSPSFLSFPVEYNEIFLGYRKYATTIWWFMDDCFGKFFALLCGQSRGHETRVGEERVERTNSDNVPGFEPVGTSASVFL